MNHWEDPKVLARFWAKVDREPEDGCWLWTSHFYKTGYGQFYLAGRQYRAHRLAWEIANKKPVPDGMFICHSCDVRACVNPAHLWPGSAFDNMSDAARKGRHHYGARDHCNKGHLLTGANVRVRKLPNGHQRRVCRVCHNGYTTAFRRRQGIPVLTPDLKRELALRLAKAGNEARRRARAASPATEHGGG